MKKTKKAIFQRKWTRFRIINARNLKAQILEGMDKLSQIRSLSLGGCSFLSRRMDARLLLNPKVRVSLEMMGKRLTLEGVVHYCQFLPQLGMDKNIVGIEFVWPDQEHQQEFGLLLGKAVSEGNLEQISVVEV